MTFYTANMGEIKQITIEQDRTRELVFNSVLGGEFPIYQYICTRTSKGGGREVGPIGSEESGSVLWKRGKDVLQNGKQ